MQLPMRGLQSGAAGECRQGQVTQQGSGPSCHHAPHALCLQDWGSRVEQPGLAAAIASTCPRLWVSLCAAWHDACLCLPAQACKRAFGECAALMAWWRRVDARGRWPPRPTPPHPPDSTPACTQGLAIKGACLPPSLLPDLGARLPLLGGLAFDFDASMDLASVSGLTQLRRLSICLIDHSSSPRGSPAAASPTSPPPTPAPTLRSLSPLASLRQLTQLRVGGKCWAGEGFEAVLRACPLMQLELPGPYWEQDVVVTAPLLRSLTLHSIDLTDLPTLLCGTR